MRIVMVGAGRSSVMAAKSLLEHGHEVVVIEIDRKRIDELYEELDCGFLHGDGSTPAILKEADPARVDFLFCLTQSDQANILASLVGRSLGFKRVVTKITTPAFQPICRELQLDDIIIPDQTIGRYLADMVQGERVVELSTFIRGDARFFSFVAEPALADTTISALGLPSEARAVCMYRGEEFVLPDADTKLREHDEVVVLTHARHLAELGERFPPKHANE